MDGVDRDALGEIYTVIEACLRILDACAPHPTRAEVPGDLSAHQVRVLSMLHPVDPTMVTELAEAMRVTPSTTSLNLKRLEVAGYVVRSRDPEDRRVRNVRLTERGSRVVEEHRPLDPAHVGGMLGQLVPEERSVAVAALVRLADGAARYRERAREDTVRMIGDP